MGVLVASVVAGAVLTGCGSDDEEPQRDDSGLAPTFAPATDDADEPAPTTTGVIVLGGTDAVGPDATAPAVPAGPTEAAVVDPEGDATASPADPAPVWSDLIGARLTRSQQGFELRVRLAGGDAPEGSGSGDHTMNVASFYDVDGDGEIDFEVWANLADGGWDTSYFDDEGGGHFGEESFVDVTTEGDEVVLRFARRHLGDAERFRWSVASEWGRYAAIGTPAMVRDQAPDGDGAADFPGA